MGFRIPLKSSLASGLNCILPFKERCVTCNTDSFVHKISHIKHVKLILSYISDRDLCNNAGIYISPIPLFLQCKYSISEVMCRLFILNTLPTNLSLSTSLFTIKEGQRRNLLLNLPKRNIPLNV